MTELVTISIEDATKLSLDILRSTGLGKSQCEAVTKVVIQAQQDACHSHGLYRLLGCVHSVMSGRVNRLASPRITDAAPSIVKVDADHGFSSLAYERGIELTLDKARRQGVATLVINNCYHFSALWPEVEPLARRGFVALALTPSHSWVAPAGGSLPVFGTNPIAFAWPRLGGDPFVFDFATSATARGEIELHRRAGTEIGPGLAIDPDGRPTTNPVDALKGAMLTFGGHKGSALSAMVELLGGALIGDMLSLESKAFDGGDGTAPLHGELIVVFDPAVFLGPALEDNLKRAELLFDAILSQGARLPSQRRYEARRKALRDGMRIPRELYRELLQLMPERAQTS